MMKESRKVYGWLALLGFALFALSSIAGQRVVVSQLPEAARPLAEVETNVVFSTGAATDNKWTLTIERDAATSNSVEVVFGCDANEDGVLGIEEGELSIGWDCGEWFWRDRCSNAGSVVAADMFASVAVDWCAGSGRGFTESSDTRRKPIMNLLMHGRAKEYSSNGYDIPSGTVKALQENSSAGTDVDHVDVGAEQIKPSNTGVYSL